MILQTLAEFWKSVSGIRAWEGPSTRWLFVDGKLYISSLHLTRSGTGSVWDIFSETPIYTIWDSPIWELRPPSKRKEGGQAAEYQWDILPVHPFRARAWAAGKLKSEYRPGAVWAGREEHQVEHEDMFSTPITDTLIERERIVENPEWTGLSG